MPNLQMCKPSINAYNNKQQMFFVRIWMEYFHTENHQNTKTLDNKLTLSEKNKIIWRDTGQVVRLPPGSLCY